MNINLDKESLSASIFPMFQMIMRGEMLGVCVAFLGRTSPKKHISSKDS